MKLQPRKLQIEEKEKYIKALDALYTIIASLKDRDEVRNLLKVVLTESERLMIGRRLLVAQLLLHDICYNKIVDELGVGIDTIMRVHKILENEEGGVAQAVKNLEKELGSRKEAHRGEFKTSTGVFSNIKRRYPAHMALFNLIDKIAK